MHVLIAETTAHWADGTAQWLQVMTWCVQLMLANAPGVDPDFAHHWADILTGQHFAGEFWRGPNGMASWWADVIDTLLDLVLRYRIDH